MQGGGEHLESTEGESVETKLVSETVAPLRNDAAKVVEHRVAGKDLPRGECQERE